MNNTPMEIKLLFDNEYLETTRFIFIVYYLIGKRKYISLEEYIYYELVLSVMNEKDKIYLKYKYFKIDKYLRQTIIYLNTLNYIGLKIEKTKTINNIKIYLTDKGKKYVVTLKSKYFFNIKNEIVTLDLKNEDVKYKKSNYKELLKALNDEETFKNLQIKYKN